MTPRRKRRRLPAILDEARAVRADPILTRGTTVRRGIGVTLVTQGDIPRVFRFVADPVGPGIVRSREEPGRPKLTCTSNRMPETVTFQTMRPHIGLLVNTDE